MDSLKFHLKEHTFNNSCGYGNYLIGLLDENSVLYKETTQCVVCFLDIDTLNDELSTILEALIKLKQHNKTVFVNTMSAYAYYTDTYTLQTVQKELEYNQLILQYAKEYQLLVLDFHSIVKRLGSDNVYSDKYWYMGKIKYTPLVYQSLGQEISKLLTYQHQSCKKCLVLDLDNTLWKGVIGEGEIELGNEGIGAIYQEFHKTIKRLKEFGIILAINSKNNMEDALEGLNHPASILKPDDFILIKANWQNKNENIKAIAQELNIGEDALVFIDDNPVERELVSQTTQAIVPDFPEDIFTLNKWFIKEVVYTYFYKLEVTNEDKNKQQQYQAKLQRDAVEQSMDYDAFIKSLQIKLHFLVDDLNHVQRFAQLTQKTNQFNLTTKRYSVEDIKRFIQSNDYLVLGVEYQDRYAKEGIIGLAICEKKSDEVIIDTLLLSCRVLKRNVEYAMIDKMMQLLNPKKLIGLYEPTKKNGLVKDLYVNLGFTQINEQRFEKE